MSKKSSNDYDIASLDSNIDIVELTKVKPIILTDKKKINNIQHPTEKRNANMINSTNVQKSVLKSTKNNSNQKQNVTFADTKLKNPSSNIQNASILKNPKIKNLKKADSTPKERVNLLESKSDSSIFVNENSKNQKKEIPVKNLTVSYNDIKNDKKSETNLKQQQVLTTSNTLSTKVSAQVTKDYNKDENDMKKKTNLKKLNTNNSFSNNKRENKTPKSSNPISSNNSDLNEKNTNEPNSKKTTSKLPSKNNKNENLRSFINENKKNSSVQLNSREAFTGKILIILSKCFEMGYLGLLFYLFYQYLVNLFLKHFFYLISSLDIYFNAEYVLICMYGLCQSLMIIFVYHKMLINHKHLNLIHVLFLSSQLLMFFLLGSIQFVFGMNVWDHKYRLIYCFNSELVKFVLLLFWLIISDTFRFFNYYLKRDPFFLKNIDDGHVISELE